MVQLPGLNTPQFDHCLSKMPRHPMPVPPIFQPEVAARAVYWAAHHRRRELYVGFPTVYTIIGNKLAPWLAERYLARTAVDGQQTPDAVDRNRRGEPVRAGRRRPRRGRPRRVRRAGPRRSAQAWLSRHRIGSALGLAAAATAAGVLVRRAA